MIALQSPRGCRSQRSLQKAASAVLALGLLLIAPAAAQPATNVIAALQAASKWAPASWGSVNLGRPAPQVVDPRAAGTGQRLSQWLQSTSWMRPRASASVNASSPALPGLVLRLENQTVMQWRPPPLTPSAVPPGAPTPEATARAFLRDRRAWLRLSDPDLELALDDARSDEQGRRHLRFSQQCQGLPVWPAGLSVHLDPEGRVELVDGAYVPTPSTALPGPVISAAMASARAGESVRPAGRITTGAAALIWFAPSDSAPRLAWKVAVSAGLAQAWQVIVDATDGRVLRRLPECCDANVPTSAKDLLGQTRSFNVWSAPGGYYLVDTTKPSFNPAFDPLADARGVIRIYDARLATEQTLQTIYLMQSATVGNWLPDAVSAAYNFGLTYDYFLARHNRNSLDGEGGNVQAVVRVAGMDNAFWNGQAGFMVFGNVRPYPAALDVVGHELTHGVIQHAADLVYELQPGALNESFADIFGEMVEARANGQPDWKMGTELGKTFRDLKNPGSILIEGLNRPYPARMSEFLDLPNSADADHGGVHLNSSIVNHAFYLLAEGLPGAIGRLDAERIFYRCLTLHLQKQSQFIDARLGCLAAAEALFGAGSAQAQRTAEAFDAVEIFATPPTPAPPPLPVVDGADATLIVARDLGSGAIVLGRRETAFGDPADGAGLAGPVRVARPSVSGDGTVAVFVSEDYDLGAVETADPSSVQYLGFPGQVHSVAMSADGRYYAFVLRDAVTGQPDNRITVLDAVAETNRTYSLVVPVADAGPQDLVLHADSMVFTADGRQLIYDALAELRLGGGGAVQRWSISRIDLETGTTTVLVPPLEGFDTGNPSLGRAGNRYLTFDAQDVASGNTGVLVMDLFTGQAGLVGSAGTASGYPCFTGDESAVIYAVADNQAVGTGRSLVRQVLTADRLGTQGQPGLWLSDAAVGVIYRRGAFTSTNAVPTVSLEVTPANGSLTAPANLALRATAGDEHGISRVEFYEGSRKLGEDSTPPYAFDWTGVAAGNYRVTARAIDSLGGAADSTAVTVTITAGAPIRVAATRLPGGSVRLVVTATPGSYTIEDAGALGDWHDAFPLSIGATGNASVDDGRTWTGRAARFYRVRKN